MDFLTKKELKGLKNDVVKSSKEIEAEKKYYENLLKEKYGFEIDDYFNKNKNIFQTINNEKESNEKKTKKSWFENLKQLFGI